MFLLLASCSPPAPTAESCASDALESEQAEARAAVEDFLADPENLACCNASECSLVGGSCETYAVANDRVDPFQDLYAPLLECRVACVPGVVYAVCEEGSCTTESSPPTDTGRCE